MNILRRLRTQDAIYWAPLGISADTGQETYAAPAAIKCRWADTVELVTFRDGTQGASTAIVDCDRVPEEGGVLRKGRLSEMSVALTAAPFALPGSWKIQSVHRVPKVRAKADDNPDKTLLRAIL